MKAHIHSIEITSDIDGTIIIKGCNYPKLLANKSPVLVAQNIINSIFGVVGLFFITRFFSLAWGILSFGIGFVGLFSLIGDLGFSTATIRAHSKGEDEAAVNSTYFFVKIILGMVFASITVISLLLWTDVLRKGFEYDSEFWVIIELIPYYFIRNLLAFPQSSFTSKIHSARMGIPSIVEAVIRNGAFVGFGALYYEHFINIGQSEMVYILPLIYVASFSAYFVMSMLLGRPWKFSRPNGQMMKTLTAIALPLAFAMSLGTINQNIDKVLIQFYWQAAATGAFYLNQRIAVILLNLSVAISIFFVPLLTRYMKSGDMKYVNDSINDFERIIILFVLPFIVITFVLSPYILNIFNGYYKEYALVLPLLSLTALLTAFYQPFQSAIIAKGMTRTVGMVSTISVTINIILDFVLIPQSFAGTTFFSLGVDGAALASTIAALYAAVHMMHYVRKITGYRFRVGILKLILPTSAEIILLELFIMIVQPYPFIDLLAASVMALLVFYALTLLVKETTVKEITQFLTNLNPLVFARHLNEEKKNQ